MVLTRFPTIFVFSIIVGFVVAGDQLLFVINIWRHGDRAPARGFSSNETANDPIFVNGLGKLTEQGRQNAFRMGEFLRDRYLTTGFITDPEEMTIRSTSHERTRETATEALRAMFGSGERPPLDVKEGIDWMLKPYYLQCPALMAIQEAKCQGTVKFTADYKNFENYEYDLWRCAGLDKKAQMFGTDRESFGKMESILNEHLNNYTFTGDITEEHIREADMMYRLVQRITLGIGVYHEPLLLRLYSGELLYNIMHQLKMRELCTKIGDCDGQKFQGYSSQDLQLFPLLEMLNATAPSVGDGAPLYTSGVFFELYRTDTGSFYVKVFYRRGSNNEFIDVTQFVPNCGVAECPFELFRSCCSFYMHPSNEVACSDVDRLRPRLEALREHAYNGIISEDYDYTNEQTSATRSPQMINIMIAIFIGYYITLL